MYECGTGKKVFSELHSNPLALTMKLMMGSRPSFPNDVAPSYRELAEKCWNDSAELRPSFENVITELMAITST